MYYYVWMHDMCVDTSATEVCGAQKTALQSRFSPSTLTQSQGENSGL